MEGFPWLEPRMEPGREARRADGLLSVLPGTGVRALPDVKPVSGASKGAFFPFQASGIARRGVL